MVARDLLSALIITLLQAACGTGLSGLKQENPFDFNLNGKGPMLTVVGDSLSTGVLASTTMGKPIPKSLEAKIEAALVSGSIDLMAFQGPLSEFDKAATTTDQNWGVRAAIAKTENLIASDVSLFLAARWGGESESFFDFVPNLEQWYKKRGMPADYVVVLIGGNDYCHLKALDEFKKHYTQMLQKVISMHPKSQIFVSKIPLIYSFAKMTHRYSPVLSCEVFRESYCKTMFLPDAEKILESYNDFIAQVTNDLAKGYSGRLTLVSGLESVEFVPSDLSFDCFHPSESGQRKIAGVLATAILGKPTGFP